MSLPTAPSRTMSQDTFDSTVDAFLGALPQFETDMNNLATAMTLNATTATSATSNSVGAGSKSFTATVGKSFWPGMWLLVADTAAPSTNYMLGQVTSYNSTTGALVFSSVYFQGSGTKTAWSISQSAPNAFSNTIGVGGATPATTGAGISFPATQSASTDVNTLDDYEEGTWTPVVYGTTDPGAGTYTAQAGRYTKIGNLVTVELYLIWTAHTGTGNMRISGLPFSISGTMDANAAIGIVGNIALTAGNYLLAYGAAGQAYIILLQVPTGGGAAAAVPIDVAANIEMTITYRVA